MNATLSPLPGQTTSTLVRAIYPFLASNEKVLLEMRGIVGIAVANPLFRLVYAIFEIIALIFGFRTIATLIVTDQRAIINSKTYLFWVLSQVEASLRSCQVGLQMCLRDMQQDFFGSSRKVM